MVESNPECKTNLQFYRLKKGLSRHQLAKLSGVNFYSIRSYEQKLKDINKAQVSTVFQLAKVLECEIIDLLEDIEKR